MNKRTLATLLATALAAFLLASFTTGCKGSFTEADSGKTLTTAPGGMFDVQLKGNYTTGFTWDVADCDMNIVQIKSAEYVPNKPQLAGSGGVQHYAFGVVGRGQTTLKIVYHRAWERNIPPALTFMLKIDSK